MVKFATVEWGEKLKEYLSQNKEFKKVAKNFEGSFLLIMEPAPEQGFPEEKRFFTNCKRGEILEIVEISPSEDKEANYKFKGSYENWKAVAVGELDPIRAITEKKFEIIAGDVRELLKHVKSINIMIGAIKDIQTEF